MEISLLLGALVLSTLLHFGIQKIFIRFKKFDDFNHRSSHKTLATRTGGIGIFSSLLLISLFHYFQGVELFDYSLFIPLGIMFIIGVYDDFYNADFKLKFFLQIIVAKILIDQGYVISNYHGLFGLYEVPRLLAQLSTVFVFLVVVNAINFIDGIDGLAITEVIKTLVLIELFSSSFTSLFPIGALVIASLIPLYFFNFKKKRKVFLGDGGSMLLGTLVMVYLLYILGPDYSLNLNYQINKVLFSVLVTLYPLIDLLRVFILRIKNGTSPFVADQRHIHHYLFKRIKYAWLVDLTIIGVSIFILIIAIF
jgi:UDP-N-acetylmuramyl pentapeptide phosphotransferase/UDP-N-acetylglucosamine-1-phosphate transferase